MRSTEVTHLGYLGGGLADLGLTPGGHRPTERRMFARPKELPRLGREQDAAVLVDQLGVAGLAHADRRGENTIDLRTPPANQTDKIALRIARLYRDRQRDGRPQAPIASQPPRQNSVRRDCGRSGRRPGRAQISPEKTLMLTIGSQHPVIGTNDDNTMSKDRGVLCSQVENVLRLVSLASRDCLSIPDRAILQSAGRVVNQAVDRNAGALAKEEPFGGPTRLERGREPPNEEQARHEQQCQERGLCSEETRQQAGPVHKDFQHSDRIFAHGRPPLYSLPIFRLRPLNLTRKWMHES